MIIAHNLGALNSFNKLNKNANATTKVLEKLSSGLRINRASDDAAGLSISEKMRAQIRGLNQAERNIQDGMSLTQVAEGGLGQVEDSLQRMRELCVQAANGTLCSKDRQNIQDEVNQIIAGIDNTANNTNFNGIPLLNRPQRSESAQGTPSVSWANKITSGPRYDMSVSWSSSNIAFSTTTGDTYMINSDGTNEHLILTAAYSPTLSRDGTKIAYVGCGSDTGINICNIDGSGKVKVSNATTLTSYSGYQASLSWSYDDQYIYYGGNFGQIERTNVSTGLSEVVIDKFDSANLIEASISPNGNSILFSTDNYEIYLANSDGTGIHKLVDSGFAPAFSPDGTKFAYMDYSTGGISVMNIDGSGKTNLTEGLPSGGYMNPAWSSDGKQIAFYSFTDKDIWVGNLEELFNTPTSYSTPAEITLQVGAGSGDTFVVTLSDVRSSNIGISDVVVDPAEMAMASIGKVDSAINTVSSERSRFGAYHNALEHVINNVSNYEINLSTAESRIRDADMSKEMIDMVKNNILSQASQAMLAQANQIPQGILQLLK
ncbi:flagellin [Ruminiclostridium cellobioparum]|uniref:flagellin n=1 Tax=Ruminiclostridium cellobioparum TaxID=29355 RepID=UPI0028AE779B|nr:flagellin [Ruminiclostridium cellobioparum]